jgi:hypothetical protein
MRNVLLIIIAVLLLTFPLAEVEQFSIHAYLVHY